MRQQQHNSRRRKARTAGPGPAPDAKHARMDVLGSGSGDLQALPVPPVLDLAWPEALDPPPPSGPAEAALPLPLPPLPPLPALAPPLWAPPPLPAALSARGGGGWLEAPPPAAAPQPAAAAAVVRPDFRRLGQTSDAQHLAVLQAVLVSASGRGVQRPRPALHRGLALPWASLVLCYRCRQLCCDPAMPLLPLPYPQATNAHGAPSTAAAPGPPAYAAVLPAASPHASLAAGPLTLEHLLQRERDLAAQQVLRQLHALAPSEQQPGTALSAVLPPQPVAAAAQWGHQLQQQLAALAPLTAAAEQHTVPRAHARPPFPPRPHLRPALQLPPQQRGSPPAETGTLQHLMSAPRQRLWAEPAAPLADATAGLATTAPAAAAVTDAAAKLLLALEQHLQGPGARAAQAQPDSSDTAALLATLVGAASTLRGTTR